ncbi:hypothetical protein [Vallitalea guaymasensis]|uniref:hypothetical protein n=1 Tax=Vallitalea guaymasensis TaxID=1185412 RepID=UPI000DE539BB|nr:hypothetical protein [Vallitalea guaymasensis]
MNYAVSEKYKNIDFTDEQIEMFIDIINSSSLTSKAFIIVARHTPSKTNKDLVGITLKGIKDELGVTRPTCDKVVGILIGASVVFYEETGKGGFKKYFKLTKRGASIIKKMVDKKQNLKE